jgi:hypothetical protein
MGYLYLSLDSDIPLEDLDLFLPCERPLANNAYVLCPSMFFRLISSDKKYEATSSNFKEVTLLPMCWVQVIFEGKS